MGGLLASSRRGRARGEPRPQLLRIEPAGLPGDLQDVVEHHGVELLLQHGEDDRVALPDGTRWFFERVTHPDKELKTYPGGYHNLFIDINWREVLRDIDEWISRRL